MAAWQPGAWTDGAWQGTAWGPSAPATDQEGFRFGADDGSESAHTWLAAQDANATAALDSTVLARFLINGTGDPASAAYTLRAQKNGAGGYTAVPVGASVAAIYGTVTFGAIGTGTNGGTTADIGYPTGITAGQYLLLHVTGGATNSETPDTPSGWTLLATGASTDGTYGNDTGPRRATVFGKEADGTESGSVTVTITNGGGFRGSMSRWTKSGSGSWEVTAQGAADSTSGTDVSMTFASMNWNTGDAVAVVVGQRVDNATQSAQSLTASGVTFGARTNRATQAVTFGNDHRHVVDTFAAASATSDVNAAPTWAYTASAAASAGGVIVRLREYTAPVANELFVKPSANITAGGEATTARLTAPSGKTTSDFDTGRRWDDENGADSTDITLENYTELEWSLGGQAPAVDTDYWDLRVYAGAVALDTYSVTARLTMGGGTEPRTLSASGAATAAFTSQSIAQKTVSAAGAAVPAWVSAAINPRAVAGAGAASAAWAAQAISQRTVSVSGVATATWAAQSLAARTITAAGAASASWAAQSLAPRTVSVSGIAAATWSAQATVPRTLASAGVASAAFVGQDANSAYAARTITVAGVGATAWSAAGISPRTVSAAGVGAAAWAAAALAPRTLAATGAASATWASQAFAPRSVSAAGVGATAWAAAGINPRTVSAAGVGATAWSAAGISPRTVSAAGVGAAAWAAAALAPRILSSTGASTGAWAAAALNPRTLAAAGVAASSWASQALVPRTLTVAGVAAVVFDGEDGNSAYAARTLTAAGVASAAWAARALLPAVFTSAGVGAFAPVSASVEPRTLTAAGTAEFSADGYDANATTVQARTLSAAGIAAVSWAGAAYLPPSTIGGAITFGGRGRRSKRKPVSELPELVLVVRASAFFASGSSTCAWVSEPTAQPAAQLAPAPQPEPAGVSTADPLASAADAEAAARRARIDASNQFILDLVIEAAKRGGDLAESMVAAFEARKQREETPCP